ncbi:MAG: O-methyltransferase [Thermoleophilaceae bacterium]
MPHDEDALDYARGHSSTDSPLLREVTETTRRELELPQMLSSVLDGGLLTAFVHAVRARLVLEIGTFSGYSALAMASALAPGGRIVTCEIDERAAAFAGRHFDASPLGERIELRLGPAIETIAELEGPFDLVFIDADKVGYRDYYEAVLGKLAPHGVIVADNTLWGGRVLDPGEDSDNTVALRAFNEHVLADERTECVLLPVGDGMTVIWGRAGGAAG